MVPTKVCKTCKQEKAVENFRWTSKRWRCNECNVCFRKRYRAYNKLPKTRVRHMVHDMNKSARKRKFDCDITEADVFRMYEDQNGKCALTGFDMTLGSSDDLIEKRYAASCDRIDNERGYTADNVWLVTARANSIKSDMTLDEIFEWCQAVTRHLSDTQLPTTKLS